MDSNSWPYGIAPKARKGTLYFGATRLAGALPIHRVETNLSHQIEYLVVALDGENTKVRLSLRQADILTALAEDEALSKRGGCVPDLQLINQ